MTRRIRIVMLFVSIVGAANYMALAGPLDPPPGPVAPTHKTLSEVEPRIAINSTNTPGDPDSLFKITQPGSYYLPGNVLGMAGKHGIEIEVLAGVPFVTIDLMGFELVGVFGSLDGIRAGVGGTRNVAIRSGTVRDWGGSGINISNSANNLLTDLRAYGNGSSGIVAGPASIVTGCTVQSVGGDGIFAEAGSTVSNCSASQNTGNGIRTGGGCTVTNCSASTNVGHGIFGGNGCTVSNCSAYENIGSGITVDSGSTVADCTARSNTLDGILCTSQSVVRGNTCTLNGTGGDGVGIHATSSGNRVEGNNCTLADRGIDVDGTGNFIARNTCSGNTTNWDVVAGNICLVVSAATSAAIVGNSGGTDPGSTDPNANFTY